MDNKTEVFLLHSVTETIPLLFYLPEQLLLCACVLKYQIWLHLAKCKIIFATDIFMICKVFNLQRAHVYNNFWWP